MTEGQPPPEYKKLQRPSGLFAEGIPQGRQDGLSAYIFQADLN